jgi:glycine cleavage system H protein
MSVHFTREHEWISVDGEVGTIGITDYAQKQLGDVVFVELPEIGASVRQGEQAGVVESVKAASEVYAPASGTVTAVNEGLSENPGLVNEDAGGGGWFFKIKIDNPAELAALLDGKSYQDYLGTLE